MIPFFSVVIPAFNRQNTIERAINSVLRQSFDDYEIIVVDDCSNDKTAEIVSGYKNIKCVTLQKNSGACTARNKGIEISNGRYVAFLDSDDEWESEHLHDIKRAIELENREIICTGGKVVGISGNKVEQFPKTDGGNVFKEELLGDVLMPTTCVAVSRKALINSGGFDAKMPARQDYDLWLRITRNYSLSVVKKSSAIIYWDNHDHIGGNYMSYINGTTRIVEKINLDTELSIIDKKKSSSIHYFYMSKVFANNNEYNKAKEYCRKSRDYMLTYQNILLSALLCFPGLYKMIRNGRKY